MINYINGYLVVRKPHLNNVIGPYTRNAPEIGGIFYGGIDRMPWFDIAQDFYDNKLPENIKHHWITIKENNADLPNINLVQDIDIAKELLVYSNQSGVQNELIAIRSKELVEIKGTISKNIGLISWVGFDIVALPEWSLLQEGIFRSLKPFLAWKKHVNSEGLFDNLSFTKDYIEAYYQASLDNLVEEVWRLDQIAFIEVGKI